MNLHFYALSRKVNLVILLLLQLNGTEVSAVFKLIVCCGCYRWECLISDSDNTATDVGEKFSEYPMVLRELIPPLL